MKPPRSSVGQWTAFRLASRARWRSTGAQSWSRSAERRAAAIQARLSARLVVSGLYGYVSATKWLQEIELTTWEDFDGYWIPRGWSKEGPIKTAIPHRCSETLQLDIAPGLQPIAGVAWAQNRCISKVEVQVDGGDWQEARTVLADKHAHLGAMGERVGLHSGHHYVRVRATDSDASCRPWVRSHRHRTAPRVGTRSTSASPTNRRCREITLGGGAPPSYILRGSAPPSL